MIECFVQNIVIFLRFRCSTGEAWPDIMMSAVSGRPCDPRAHNWNYTKVIIYVFLYLRAIFCTFQISVDFYFVPVGGRGGAGEGEGARMYTVWVHLVC